MSYSLKTKIYSLQLCYLHFSHTLSSVKTKRRQLMFILQYVNSFLVITVNLIITFDNSFNIYFLSICLSLFPYIVFSTLPTTLGRLRQNSIEENIFSLQYNIQCEMENRSLYIIYWREDKGIAPNFSWEKYYCLLS